MDGVCDEAGGHPVDVAGVEGVEVPADHGGHLLALVGLVAHTGDGRHRGGGAAVPHFAGGRVLGGVVEGHPGFDGVELQQDHPWQPVALQHLQSTAPDEVPAAPCLAMATSARRLNSS